MKYSILTVWMFVMLCSTYAQKGMDYYMSDNIDFDSSIPTPKSVLNYEVGEWMVSHDQLIYYFKIIANASERAVLKEYARSHENRPLVHLIFSSPENLDKLETIRLEHLKLSDPDKSKDLDLENMPAVVVLGYSIHGNEASGVNASLLIAYYLAAAQGEKMNELLRNTIIIVDPALNPDGVNRFANWTNMHKSKTPVIDPNSRIFNEVWPGGRLNHYWFDLNRDYLLLVHPESQGRVEQLHQWIPTVVTDHHEMGSNTTFFFQPGIQSRINPLTPEKNQILTYKIGEYHANFLDEIGSLYFTEEVFDDYYYGKGSAYPDVMAGIGILFEQGSVRGFQRQTINGIIDFPFAIRNQFTVTLSTLEAVRENRVEFLKYQREFYKDAFNKAANDDVKAIVFGGGQDKGRIAEFLKLLKNHHIDVYKLEEKIRVNGLDFSKDDSYVIPLKQSNYLLIKSLFEVTRYFEDRGFYDVSTWNIAMTFDIPMAEFKEAKKLDRLVGEKVDDFCFEGQYIAHHKSIVAWAFEWNEYYAPRAVGELLKLGLRVKVAHGPFSYKDNFFTKDFNYGSILVPAHNQNMPIAEITKKLKELAKRDGIKVYALGSGLTYKGADLGSSSFGLIRKPDILMLVEGRTSSFDSGEIWHMFDQRYAYPVTLLEVDRFSRADLNNYNVLILPGGNYNDLSEPSVKRIKSWINNGGTLIAYKEATQWSSTAFELGLKFKPSAKAIDGNNAVYGDMRAEANIHSISGAIFKTEMDLTHPLTFGFEDKFLPVFKTGIMVAEQSPNPYASPIRYTNDPLMSGYCSEKNHERIKGAPYLMVHALGSGRVISIFDNANFRGVWLASNKVITNAVFFGDQIKMGAGWRE